AIRTCTVLVLRRARPAHRASTPTLGGYGGSSPHPSEAREIDSAETVAAAAGAGDVGVVDGETRTHQTVAEVEGRTPDHLGRLGVDDHAHITELFDDVGVVDLAVEKQLVRETRAATGTHGHPQRQTWLVLGGQQLADLGDCGVGQSHGLLGPV